MTHDENNRFAQFINKNKMKYCSLDFLTLNFLNTTNKIIIINAQNFYVKNVKMYVFL